MDRAYLEFDDTRQMLERALELSSQELVRANSELRAADSDHRADSARGGGAREDCLRAGMDDYLAKPVLSGDFEKALLRWCP